MIDTHIQILAIMGEEYRHCHILSGKKHKMKSEMVIFWQQNQRAGLNFEGGGERILHVAAKPNDCFKIMMCEYDLFMWEAKLL